MSVSGVGSLPIFSYSISSMTYGLIMTWRLLPRRYGLPFFMKRSRSWRAWYSGKWCLTVAYAGSVWSMQFRFSRPFRFKSFHTDVIYVSMIKDLTREKFLELVNASTSKVELAKKLGYDYCNGRVTKIIFSLCETYNVSIDHFDRYLPNRKRLKYKWVEKKCPVCETSFKTQKGHPKEKQVCSYSCSNTYFSNLRHTSEVNDKISKSLIKYNSIRNITAQSNSYFETKICPACKHLFRLNKKETYCSVLCCNRIKNKSPACRKKLSIAVQKRIANGTHKGWTTRKKCKPSYAEKYTMNILDQLNISYEREIKVGKWFIDFADVDRKLALEIDGRQHRLPDRKASDKKKDNYLISNGWKVLRIPWRKIDNKFRIELVCKIYAFLG